jgi:pimeloyl-ACP methyl ester carboxylesterase
MSVNCCDHVTVFANRAGLRHIKSESRLVLRYELLEPEHGLAIATVVCLPGIEDTPGELGPIPEGLAAAGFRVVVSHPRGGRYSDPDRGLWSMRRLALDLRDLVGELRDIRRVNSVYVLGLSEGGMIAQTFASEHPELVKGLVLVETPTHLPIPGPAGIRDMMRKPAAEQLASDQPDVGSPATVRHLLAMLTFRDQYIRRVTCPVQIIHYRQDPLVRLPHALATAFLMKATEAHLTILNLRDKNLRTHNVLPIDGDKALSEVLRFLDPGWSESSSRQTPVWRTWRSYTTSKPNRRPTIRPLAA